ncbi:hypothetical protein [Microbacterium deminutum]
MGKPEGTGSWWRRALDSWRARSIKAARMERGMDQAHAERDAYAQLQKMRQNYPPFGGP